ncbi:NADH-quinone oxidoreductase subunit NuoH [Sulfurisphaera javensis]|uniref:NADH-quinone oxidoreductase subunit NuoH n=1 Tax=Sulfurisphaera javensis TaxID=2049879 RepID=A0AAT9GNZ5_9CREN
MVDILSAIRYYFFYPSFFAVIIFPGLIFTTIILLLTIWFERKAAARVQMRIGPLYVSKRTGGILQLIADAVRLVFSEIIVPVGVNPTLYVLAPIFPIAFSFIPMVLIPFSSIPQSGSILSPYYHFFYDSNINMGVFVGYFVPYNMVLIFGLASIVPVFILLQAWATNNRFAVVGAVREALLAVSYDVLLIMSVVAMAIEYHTLDIAKVVESGIPGIVANPLAAIVFLVGMLMGTGRFPFEIVEAESELVVGPATEYSGFLFVLAMGGSYIATFALSFVFSDLFLGGWLPLNGLPGALLNAIKAIIVLWFTVFLRSVYGRYRIDQALRGSWKYLLPVAFASLVLGMVVGWLWIK